MSCTSADSYIIAELIPQCLEFG